MQHGFTISHIANFGKRVNKAVVNLLRALIGDPEDKKGPIGKVAIAAYLVMMTARLTEPPRVLKPTDSLYLHCDPSANHYLKLILHRIFGKENSKQPIERKRGEQMTLSDI